MRLNLIVAMAANRVIGANNGIPWRLPADFAWFKRQTMGHPVIMGRKTFESIGRPLPGRRNVVVTRNPGYAAQGIEVSASLDAALRATADAAEVFVIGGAELYRQALPLADRLLVTLVDATPAGDTRFPEWPHDQWRETASEARDADERNAHAMRFTTWERTAPSLDKTAKHQ